ncbi:hypothetical protein Tco_1216454 [Tanacetum coccineum]
MGEGSTNLTDPHHTPTIIQLSTQPQKTQKPRKPKRKDTQVPHSSDPSENVADKCDNHDLSRYVRLDNQSIERDRLIGIGFVLNFVTFISFTFGDKEMMSMIEAVSL